jgi:hypothetical protein
MANNRLSLFGISHQDCPANYRLAIVDPKAITVLAHRSIWGSFCDDINCRHHPLSPMIGGNNILGEAVPFVVPGSVDTSFGYRNGVTRTVSEDAQWEALQIKLPTKKGTDGGKGNHMLALANTRAVLVSLMGSHSTAQEPQLLAIWQMSLWNPDCSIGCRMSQAIVAWLTALTVEQRARIEAEVSLAMRTTFTVIRDGVVSPISKSAGDKVGMQLSHGDGIDLYCYGTNSGSLSAGSISKAMCGDLLPHNMDSPYQALVTVTGLAKLYEIARAALYPSE